MTDQSTYEALKETGSKLAEVLAQRLWFGTNGQAPLDAEELEKTYEFYKKIRRLL